MTAPITRLNCYGFRHDPCVCCPSTPTRSHPTSSRLPTGHPIINNALASDYHAVEPSMPPSPPPTVAPSLAAPSGKRASSKAKPPCPVLFRSRSGHDTGRSPWLRGLYGPLACNCFSPILQLYNLGNHFRAYNCCRHICHMKSTSTRRVRAWRNSTVRLTPWYLRGDTRTSRVQSLPRTR